MPIAIISTAKSAIPARQNLIDRNIRRAIERQGFFVGFLLDQYQVKVISSPQLFQCVQNHRCSLDAPVARRMHDSRPAFGRRKLHVEFFDFHTGVGQELALRHNMPKLRIEVEYPIKKWKHLANHVAPARIEYFNAGLIQRTTARRAHGPIVSQVSLAGQPGVASLQRHEPLSAEQLCNPQIDS